MLNSYIELDTSQSLDFLNRQVEMEAFKLSAVSKILNGLSNSITSFGKTIDRLYNRVDYIPLLSINTKKLKKNLDTYNYLDLQDFKIHRPIGLTSSYTTLLDLIDEIQVDLLDIEDRVITPFLKVGLVRF